MPEPKNYEVVITAFKIGDPTFQIGLKSPSTNIQNLQIQVELTIEETIVVLNTSIPSLPKGETALLMGSFTYPNEVPNNNVTGQLSLTTTVSGDTFSVSSEEGVPEFTAESGNLFTTENTPIILNSELPSGSVIEAENMLAIQCIDEEGNAVFLTGYSSNNVVSLLPVFNPYLNPGSQWQLLTGPHPNTFYLKCLTPNTNLCLYGETNNSEVFLYRQEHNHHELWLLNHNAASETNVYNIQCYQSGQYKFLHGNTINGQVSLVPNYSTEDKTVNWYFTKLN